MWINLENIQKPLKILYEQPENASWLRIVDAAVPRINDFLTKSCKLWERRVLCGVRTYLLSILNYQQQPAFYLLENLELYK